MARPRISSPPATRVFSSFKRKPVITKTINAWKASRKINQEQLQLIINN